jgi:cytochrome P450
MNVPSIPAEGLFSGNARSYGDDGLVFYERCEALGPIVRARIFHRHFYVVTGPDLVEQVLVKRAQLFEKPLFLRQMKLVFGDGLLTSKSPLWRHRRRLLQPVFRRERMASYASHISSNVAAMMVGWEEGQTRDIHEEVVDVCIRNLTETLFAVRDPELTRHVKELAALCQRLSQSLGSFAFPYYAAFPILFRTRFGPEVRARTAALVACIGALRSERAAAGMESDFVGQLTNARDLDGCPFRSQALADEIVTMVLAGHETAAAAVSWAIQLLSMHPTVRQDLARQLSDVCGDRAVMHHDLERLPLLEQVLLETYRLYPPTHCVGRTATEDLELGGVQVRAGQDVILPQWAVHRSARHYDEPLEFRPWRWSGDFTKRLPRFAFFPFGGGPRRCIGESLVRAEDALIIGNIVRSFEFELAHPPQEPVEGLTLLPGRTPKMRVRLRAAASPCYVAPPRAALNRRIG